MKAILLGLVLFVFPFPQEEQEARLSLMPSAATGLSHGYALWTTGQTTNKIGCLFGLVKPGQVEVHAAGFVKNGVECAAEEQAIGMVVFLHEDTTQDQACEVARVMRSRFAQLVVIGLVHGLEIRQLPSGLDYTSPQVRWCSTPIDSSPSDFDSEPLDLPPLRITTT